MMDIQTNSDRQQGSISNLGPQPLREAFNRGFEDFVSYIESLPEKKQQRLLELFHTDTK